MKLHDYQMQIAESTLRALESHDRIVVACPTGAGKTVVAMHGIVPKLQGGTAWITHRRELAKQARMHQTPISVFMAQREITGDFANLIIDEGHHVCAAQYRKIINDFPQAKIIALTATPYRLDGVGLGSCGFSSIIHGPDTYDLTEMGMLCPVRVMIPKSEDIRAWGPKAAADQIAKQRFKKGVAFCRSVPEAKALAKCLRANGVPALSIDGTTANRERDAAFRSFEKGRIRVMCNHSIFTEGVDVPAIDLVVLNRHTMSRCLWKQMIGRGTRNHKNKRRCMVLDLAGNGVMHGSIYDREIYDLHGRVESTESRQISKSSDPQQGDEHEYEYNQGEELKEWKPQPKPVRIIESLQKLKSKSPLLRLRTG